MSSHVLKLIYWDILREKEKEKDIGGRSPFSTSTTQVIKSMLSHQNYMLFDGGQTRTRTSRMRVTSMTIEIEEEREREKTLRVWIHIWAHFISIDCANRVIYIDLCLCVHTNWTMTSTTRTTRTTTTFIVVHTVGSMSNSSRERSSVEARFKIVDGQVYHCFTSSAWGAANVWQ